MLKLIALKYSFYWVEVFWYKYLAFPVFIKIAILFIFLSVFFSLMLPIFTIFIRRRYRQKEKVDRFKSRVIILFKKILFENYLKEPEEIYEEFKNRVLLKGKQVHIEEDHLALAIESLVEIKSNAIEESNRYELIIKALKLEKFIQSKFEYSSSGNKMRGINEMSFLAINTSDIMLIPFAYSANKHIQSEARLSYLNLSKNDPYRFFDEFEEQDMTHWVELKLLNSLIGKSKINSLPNFGKWINYSKNKSLVAFLIKVAVYFNQTEALEVIYSKIEEELELVKSAAFAAIGPLKGVAYEEELKQMYPFQSNLCQMAIIKSIGILNTGRSLAFLEKVFYESVKLENRKIIAMIILHYGEDGKQLFEKIKLDFEDKATIDSLVFKHVESDIIFFK